MLLSVGRTATCPEGGGAGAAITGGGASTSCARAAAVQASSVATASTRRVVVEESTRASYRPARMASKESALGDGALWYTARHGKSHPGAGRARSTAAHHGSSPRSRRVPLGSRADAAHADALPPGGSARGHRGDRGRRCAAPQGGAGRLALPGHLPGAHRARGREARLLAGVRQHLRQAYPSPPARLRRRERLRLPRGGEELGAYQGGGAEDEGR